MKEDIQKLLDQRVITITHDRDPVDEVNVIVPQFNMPEPVEIVYDSQTAPVAPLIICPPGPVPYNSDQAIPYKYNATMIENGVEVPIPPMPSFVSIADVSRVTRSGRIFAAVPLKRPEVQVRRPIPAEIPARNVEPRVEIGRSNEPIPHPEDDEILKLIKRSEYKIVDQLLQTPSKISLLALLRDSGAHRDRKSVV